MHPCGPHPPIWFLVFPLVSWRQKFPFKAFFGILSSSILIMWPPQCKWGLGSSGLLLSVCWYLFADVLDPWRWDPIGCPETSVDTNIRWVTSQKSQYLTSQGFSNPEPSSSVWVRGQCELTLRDPPLSPGGRVASRVTEPAASCSLQPCSVTSETAVTYADLKRVLRPFCRLIPKLLDCGLFTFASEDSNRGSVLGVVTRLRAG